MRDIETVDYNMHHMIELVRAQWVSKELKAKADFLIQDFEATKAKGYSDEFLMAIGDGYTNALMDDYTNEFKILRSVTK